MTHSVDAELFTIRGSPYRGDLVFSGAPLAPSQLWSVLDLDRPGLEKARAAVAAGDTEAAGRALLEYFRQRREPAWLPGPTPIDQAPRARRAVPAADLTTWTASVEDRAIADRALRHVFQPLGAWAKYPPHDYGPVIDWDADPVNDIEWPAVTHRFLGWSGPLTRTWSATGDERYAQLWVDLVSDWIKKNPVTADRLAFPQSWDTPQAGIRIQQWAGFFPYYLNSRACTPAFLIEFLTSLYNHGRRLELLPYPNTDNFKMMEATGLAYVAALFPEFRDATRWRELAIARMEQARRDQFLPDGVHGEFSPGYHAVMLGYYLDLLELEGSAQLPPELAAGTRRMAAFLEAVAQPDHRLFCIGDTRPDDVGPLLVRSRQALGGDTAPQDAAFPDAGFYVFRAGSDNEAVWFGMHCGPPSPIDPSQWHSHFDSGTFELWALGRKLMSGPGVYSYKDASPEREQFRRTAAHQTLTLDNRNSDRAGRLLQWQPADDRGIASVTVENAAYPGLVHRRTVFFVAGGRAVVLVDEALGGAAGELDLHFQLTPGPPGTAVIDPSTKTARTAFPDGGNVLVWTPANAPVTLVPETAWYSRVLFEREPLPALCYRHQSLHAPARFLTVLAPYRGTTPPAIDAAIVGGAPGDPSVEVRLRLNADTWLLRRSLK